MPERHALIRVSCQTAPLPVMGAACPDSRICSMLAALGVPIYTTEMQRLTARLLLLFALGGNLVPIALAVTAAPLHACCLRKAARQHRCHDESGVDSSELVLRGAGCCRSECERAVTSAQWAYAQQAAAAFLERIELRLTRPESAFAATQIYDSRSTRAPPHFLSA